VIDATFTGDSLPYLAGISIYPVKSLEPALPREARLLRSGALEGDRSFALFDSEDKFVNGKRFAKIHLLRSKYDFFTQELSLGRADSGLTASFHVDRDRLKLETWLTEFFSFPVFFRRNVEVGFPDDLDCPGPTVISTATLNEVASWFPPLDAQQLRLRIRANLEIGGVPPFWEERLYTVKGSVVRFRVGDCLFDGNNPCQRCVVPPRDPFSGDGYPKFSEIFRKKREETLPEWAEKSRFNHYYRLAINTLVPAEEAGKTVRVGDVVEVVQ
jgi:MOSC domain-containing protein